MIGSIGSQMGSAFGRAKSNDTSSSDQVLGSFTSQFASFNQNSRDWNSDRLISQDLRPMDLSNPAVAMTAIVANIRILDTKVKAIGRDLTRTTSILAQSKAAIDRTNKMLSAVAEEKNFRRYKDEENAFEKSYLDDAVDRRLKQLGIIDSRGNPLASSGGTGGNYSGGGLFGTLAAGGLLYAFARGMGVAPRLLPTASDLAVLGRMLPALAAAGTLSWLLASPGGHRVLTTYAGVLDDIKKGKSFITRMDDRYNRDHPTKPLSDADVARMRSGRPSMNQILEGGKEAADRRDAAIKKWQDQNVTNWMHDRSFTQNPHPSLGGSTKDVDNLIKQLGPNVYANGGPDAVRRRAEIIRKWQEQNLAPVPSSTGGGPLRRYRNPASVPWGEVGPRSRSANPVLFWDEVGPLSRHANPAPVPWGEAGPLSRGYNPAYVMPDEAGPTSRSYNPAPVPWGEAGPTSRHANPAPVPWGEMGPVSRSYNPVPVRPGEAGPRARTRHPARTKRGSSASQSYIDAYRQYDDTRDSAYLQQQIDDLKKKLFQVRGPWLSDEAIKILDQYYQLDAPSSGDSSSLPVGKLGSLSQYGSRGKDLGRVAYAGNDVMSLFGNREDLSQSANIKELNTAVTKEQAALNDYNQSFGRYVLTTKSMELNSDKIKLATTDTIEINADTRFMITSKQKLVLAAPSIDVFGSVSFKDYKSFQYYQNGMATPGDQGSTSYPGGADQGTTPSSSDATVPMFQSPAGAPGSVSSFGAFPSFPTGGMGQPPTGSSVPGSMPMSPATAGTDQFLMDRQVKNDSSFVGVNPSGLNPIFAGRMQKLIADAEKATGGKVTITEGYRPAEIQAQYYANYVGHAVTYNGKTYTPKKRGGVAAAPGHSEHQSGMAMDIDPHGKAYEWMVQHAHEYGIQSLASFDKPHFQIPKDQMAAVAKAATDQKGLQVASLGNTAVPAMSLTGAAAPYTIDTSHAPMGMRNNNPGNIKFNSGIDWVGQVGPSKNTDQGDPQVVFDSQAHGMRAMGRNILAKYRRYGLNTIRKLITTPGIGWTPGYTPGAVGVSNASGFGLDEPINLEDPGTLARVMRGMVTQEQGPSAKSYTDAMVQQGANDALGVSSLKSANIAPPKSPLATPNTKDTADKKGWDKITALGPRIKPKQDVPNTHDGVNMSASFLATYADSSIS